MPTDPPGGRSAATGRPRVPLLPFGTSDAVARDLYPPPNRYLLDPASWVRDRTHEHLVSYQRDVIESTFRNRYTAVPSCHDSGKSFTASRAAVAWVDAHPPGEAFVVTTAPTAKQVHAVLWRELARAHDKSGAGGRVNLSDEWYLPVGNREELVAFGRKPADHDPGGFSGIHARFVLVIVDEAGGISRAMWDAIDSLVTNKGSHVLAIGNPDDPSAHFEVICRPGSGWNVIHIDGLATPNFTEDVVRASPELTALFEAEGLEPSKEWVPDSVRDLLLSPEWVIERIQRWGIESPVFTAKVRGRFPDVSDDMLITPSMIRHAIAHDEPGMETGVAAFDIASTGSSETVGYHNRGGHIRRVHAARGHDTMRTTGVIAHFCRTTHGIVPVWVDAVGLGRGVFDRGREMGLPMYAFNGGETAFQRKLYGNRRAEVHWEMREMFEAVALDIDPFDIDLHAQLQAPKWWTRSNGQIMIESKEDMQKRGIASPDRADAFGMSTSRPPLDGALMLHAAGQGGYANEIMKADF